VSLQIVEFLLAGKLVELLGRWAVEVVHRSPSRPSMTSTKAR
jgi:hypothetical protein